jgi:hypothetical protein
VTPEIQDLLARHLAEERLEPDERAYLARALRDDPVLLREAQELRALDRVLRVILDAQDQSRDAFARRVLSKALLTRLAPPRPGEGDAPPASSEPTSPEEPT